MDRRNKQYIGPVAAKKTAAGQLGAYNSQSRRGMSFENQIEATNQQYEIEGVAIIQKIPTPTKNIKGRIVYSDKSTVDFMGSLCGKAVAFEAKETSTKTNFPLVKRYKGKDVETILGHQRDFLETWAENGGLSFVLIHFSDPGVVYMVDVDFIDEYYLAMYKGGRKSIPIAAFKDEWIVNIYDYLDVLKK